MLNFFDCCFSFRDTRQREKVESNVGKEPVVGVLFFNVLFFFWLVFSLLFVTNLVKLSRRVARI